MVKEFKNLPTGTGKEFLEERGKERLPAVEVKNKVTWINPSFERGTPFKLEVGKPTSFGIFFTSEPESSGKDQKIWHPIVMPEVTGSGRSGLLGSVIFKDKAGNIYRDIDAKGIGDFLYNTNLFGGTTKTKHNVGKVYIKNPEKDEAWGLIHEDLARRDSRFSELFLRNGIRTHGVIAIIELEEVIDINGNKISIEEAKQRNMITKNMKPVVQIRAFGTKERIAYLFNGGERSKKSLFDAKAMVAQELEKNPENFSVEEYAEWFAETLGRNVARMRKLKVHHGYLTEHNITLDCRIVDLDSVDEVYHLLTDSGDTEEGFYNSDLRNAINTLSEFIIALERIKFLSSDRGWYKYRAIFLKAYEDEAGEDIRIEE